MDSRLMWVLIGVVVLYWLWTQGALAGLFAAAASKPHITGLPDGTSAPMAPMGADPMGAATSSPYSPSLLAQRQAFATGLSGTKQYATAADVAAHPGLFQAAPRDANVLVTPDEVRAMAPGSYSHGWGTAIITVK